MISATVKIRDRFMNRMNKQWSVERSVILNLRPKRNWEHGLTTDELLKKINSERKRKKEYGKGKIYDSISLINRFGSVDYGIYIASRIGWIDKKNKTTEYRYFNIKELNETDREKRKLDSKKEIVKLKEKNVEYHEKKTIPQEQKIVLLQR